MPALLAHLPLSITSLQPPPSLYPLLAPIMRQRVSLLLPSLPSADSWVSLLSWSTDDGSRLSAHLASQDLAPHPVSGSFEIGNLKLSGYRKEDEETMKSSIQLPDWGLEIHYIWVANDPDGEDDGWKVIDLHSTSVTHDSKWFTTIGGAAEAFLEAKVSPQQKTPVLNFEMPTQNLQNFVEENEDEYWDSYDCTPARTPSVPNRTTANDEASYFDSYSNVETVIKSELEGRQPRNDMQAFSPRSSEVSVAASTPPTNVSSYMQSSVHTQSDIAIKQHISATMKSLYRLARGAGIDREEFGSLVRTELTMTTMFDEE